MKLILALGAALSIGSLFADVQFSKFCECDGWVEWSPRKEISPAFSIESEGGRDNDGALKIETRSAAEFGAWKIPAGGLEGGRTYRFNVWYRTKNVPHELQAISPRVEWFDAKGKSLRPPEYGIAVAGENGWKRVEVITPSPE